MAQGLTGASQTFQRFINQVLHDMRIPDSEGNKGREVINFKYIDDIFVASDNEEKHIQDLEALFKRLTDYGLKINVLKCEFGKTELNFLGHHIDTNGIKPLKEKVSAISDYTLPIVIKDLRRYLGMLNFYRRFLPNVTETIAPLYDIVKVYNHRRKNKQIKWKP